MIAMLGVIFTLLSFALSVQAERSVSRSAGPPAFFLQDLQDGLCLAGSGYKRCGLDSLWYVIGKPGSYQIHRRPVDEDEADVCLDKAQCHLDESHAQLANCNHCGAKKWNILGDAQSGYVLTEDGNKYCLKRVGDTASIVKCDLGYSAVNLQCRPPDLYSILNARNGCIMMLLFCLILVASKDDIELMSSDGARLITAAMDNDLPSVQAFLSKDVSINARDWDNTTALMAAASKGHEEMVRFLVNRGADVHLRDKNNLTALSEAALVGHMGIITLLASKGAGMDVRAATGATPLWLAASEGRAEVVRFLLKGGADANTLRTDGISPLMAAAAGGHADIVTMLLEARADVNVHDKDGITALINAAENGSLPLVAQLLEAGAEVNVISAQGFTPLI
ncbi:hypothetical protein EON64_07725, partial [archaeon]